MTGASTTFGDTLSESYVLQRELGRGGMAIVYLPRDRKHERSVALKVLRPELGAVGARIRRPLRVRLAAGAIAPTLVGGAIATLTRSGNREVLDDNLLAVAPFDAVSSGVTEYREGLVTILSRSLDGAGPL